MAILERIAPLKNKGLPRVNAQTHFLPNIWNSVDFTDGDFGFTDEEWREPT
jgi:hypothetical protein